MEAISDFEAQISRVFREPRRICINVGVVGEPLPDNCGTKQARLRLNSRLIAEEFEAAVEVEKDENGGFSKENLCKAIKSVMGENIEEENHKKWRDLLLSLGFADNYIHKWRDLSWLLGSSWE